MGIDDGLAFEEPDTYLLRPGINNEVLSICYPLN